jgi:group I intron endonuclease
MSSGIYKIYCKSNDKAYIGQTNDFDRRFKEHKKRLNSQKMKHSCIHLKRAWQLYGKEAFEFSILEECSVEMLNEREQYYIDFYGKEKLFNIGLIAEAPKRGVKLSDETKKLLSELNSGKNNPNYGKLLTEETKRKISIANSGINNWHYGRPCTEEEKLKNSLANRGEKCHLAKLNWDLVRQLRKEFKETKTNCAELARKYYLSRFTVWDIIKERTWKE